MNHIPIIALALCLTTAPALAEDALTRQLRVNSENTRPGQEALTKLWDALDKAGKPEPQAETKQVNRAAPRPGLKAPAMKERWVLPPVEYDREFGGHMDVLRDFTEVQMAVLCPRDTSGRVALACAFARGPKYCLILVASEDAIRARGWTEDTILRHERGHCNGWPDKHPGSRLATEQTWVSQ
jgi:hypothetical protein